jgi:hypothetical protein
MDHIHRDESCRSMARTFSCAVRIHSYKNGVNVHNPVKLEK